MARWLAELTGHSFDLEELPRLFSAREFRVVQTDGGYFLEAEAFDTSTSGVAVHAEATALMPIINGIGKLKDRSFRDVAIGHVRELRRDGTTQQHVVVSADTVEGRAKVSALLVTGGETEMTAPEPGSLDSDHWLRATRANPEAQRALALWGGPHDPLNLWKVWELVRDHSGVDVDRDLVRRFRPSTNDPSIAGDDARHEVPRHKIEPDTMSLPEAEAFLGGLLIGWLSSVE